MTNPIRFFILAGAVIGATALFGACAKAEPPTSKDKPTPTAKPVSETEPASKGKPAIVLTDAETRAATEFETRVKDYVALHNKLEATLPALPQKDATPEQIDEHKRALCALIQKERKGAKQGEFFTPDMVGLVRRALGATIDGAEGDTIQQSITDDTPNKLFVNVNDGYPEGAPVSSMPLELLTTLPRLDETLEYRFVGKHLVLVDAPAQVILDVTPGVLP